jgi:uncharacterized membrane protein
MVWLAKFLLVVSLAVWLGETVFLSFVVAPSLFRNMASPQEAGNVMNLLFPTYYGIGASAALIIVACSLFLWRRAPAPNRAWLLTGSAAAVGMVACVYAAYVIQPRTHELRDQLRRESPPAAARAEFDRLHALAVQLNGGVLLLTLAAAAVVARRLH